MLYGFLRPFVILGFKILFRIGVQGRKYIPRKGGFILASNHASFLDPIILGVACPRLLNFMAKHDLFGRRFLSWLISKLGAFPVRRNSADLSAIKEAINRLNNAGGLVLFPEGSRSADEKSQEVYPGIAFLALKAGVPVVPAFIKGSSCALPKGSRFIRPKKISVFFGEQISMERRMPYDDFAKRVMESIRHLSC